MLYYALNTVSMTWNNRTVIFEKNEKKIYLKYSESKKKVEFGAGLNVSTDSWVPEQSGTWDISSYAWHLFNEKVIINSIISSITGTTKPHRQKNHKRNGEKEELILREYSWQCLGMSHSLWITNWIKLGNMKKQTFCITTVFLYKNWVVNHSSVRLWVHPIVETHTTSNVVLPFSEGVYANGNVLHEQESNFGYDPKTR